jgi:AraC-like DNA-binding protein
MPMLWTRRVGHSAMTVVIDTRSVNPEERFDFWVEGARSVFFPLRLSRVGDDIQPFSGFVRRHSLGPIALTQVVTQPTTIARTRADIISHDPQSIGFCYVRRGSMVFSQNGRDTLVLPGEIFVNDESSPMVLRTPEDTEQLVVQAPKALFGREALWAAENAGRIMSPALTRALLAPMITGLIDGLAAGDVNEDHAELGEAVLDLIRAACREPGSGTGTSAAPARTRTMQVKRYIDEHIGDPSLTSERIAAANFMSLRTLQRLFQAEGVTLTDWLRERRLAGARRDLRDPHLADVPIARIADTWGLPNPGHFSRMFRAAFGVSPREWRDT